MRAQSEIFSHLCVLHLIPTVRSHELHISTPVRTCHPLCSSDHARLRAPIRCLRAGTVLGAVLLLTLRPLFVCLMGVATLSCVAHLLAWMWLVGIRLSSISLVPLLLSVGLCIDFCTHVAHAYGEAAKTSHDQHLGTRSRPAHTGRSSTAADFTIIALQERGFAVLHAGVSTFLSVMLLAFGDSAIFTTFFWMLVGTVVIGLSHALLVLPACLSFLPDEAASAKQPEAIHAAKAPAPEAASSSWLGHRHGLAESAVPEMEIVEAAAVRL